MFQDARKICAAVAASVGIIAGLLPSVALSQADTWQTLPTMPTARTLGASGAIGGKVYFTNGSPSATSLEVYDPASNSWAAGTPSPSARSYPGSAVVGDALYVIGGCFVSDCRIGVTNLTEAYNSTSNTWATVAPMPTPRFSPAVGVINGKIYAASGGTASPPGVPQPAVLEVFDPTTNSWGSKAPIPTPREIAAGAVVRGKLYVIGGFIRPANVSTNIVEIYDPATDTWTAGAPMPTARQGAAARAINGSIHVIGGERDTPPFFLATHEVYDPATNTWSTKTPMTMPRGFLMAAAIGPKLYAAGGVLQSGVTTNFFEVYTTPLEPLVLYDDFSTGILEPAKWLGVGGDAALREVERNANNPHLALTHRAYAGVLSDSGTVGGIFGLNFARFSALTAVQFTVKALQVETVDCSPSRPTETARTGAAFRGRFFSTQSSPPGSQSGDVEVVIGIEQIAGQQLDVTAFYTMCNNASCTASTVLDFLHLGPIALGQRTTLTVQWDQGNHQFIFLRDKQPPVVSAYTVSDVYPPSSPGKFLVLARVVPNCTVAPRPTVFLKATFHKVLVNQSASP
jgi:N-acetylneuraminic acid mutarotase